MGHPDKFVRIIGTAIFVQSRVDVKCEFYDFFRDAKFSLWWLPEVNNMCRLRPTTTASSGQDGGMNFNFALHRTVNVSEVVLSHNTMPDSTNVIAVASPVFQGAIASREPTSPATTSRTSRPTTSAWWAASWTRPRR
ncbi:unnamed protein product [Prorocentrum cordatum]|uniref:Uncharacterized protein n=1 Tax=Prorocentrum cordatum TaxID=2364126 RepID=A0ABN9TIT4_9DINO|nr:unnamed protein product [Polarella glacialis]